MDRRLALSAMLFTAANRLPDEKKDDANLKVTGTATGPKDGDSFEKTGPELRLYEADPFAGNPAGEMVELARNQSPRRAVTACCQPTAPVPLPVR